MQLPLAGTAMDSFHVPLGNNCGIADKGIPSRRTTGQTLLRVISNCSGKAASDDQELGGSVRHLAGAEVLALIKRVYSTCVDRMGIALAFVLHRSKAQRFPCRAYGPHASRTTCHSTSSMPRASHPLHRCTLRSSYSFGSPPDSINRICLL
jgi:hypothetical protein